ncbi:MAG: hypothetical protein ACOCWA_10240 [Bacteroidota bacterium]
MKYSISLILFFFGISLEAQDSLSVKHLMDAEQEVLSYFNQIYEMPDSEERDSVNDLIIQKLEKSLSSWDGFYFQWSALEMIGRVYSDDNRVKIFTWYLKTEENLYDYYGLLAYEDDHSKNDEEFHVVRLRDNSADIRDPENKILDPAKWYGTVYYKLVTFSHRRDSYYTLIGFDFNDDFSNKKIIEILTIDKNGDIRFGGNINFEGEPERKRMIFEYSSEVAMTLNYDERLNMIVYDHLRPPQPFFEGNFRFYVPDGSYDGLRFEKGEFYHEEDIDARNY